MISKYFNQTVFDINKIPPIIDTNILSIKSDFWYLKSHYYDLFTATDDFFTEDEINSIIKLGNLHIEEEGRVGGAERNEHNNKIRSCKISWMNVNIYTSWIYEKLTKIVNDVNDQRFKFDLTKIENLQFSKYHENDSGFYEKHTDPMMGSFYPENRKLSIVIQLSDPSEYEGGDLCLYNGKEPIIIEKRKGRIAFFPSYTLHEVTPVTKGTRYSLVAWVHGPAFK